MPEEDPPHATFSPRQRDVLELLLSGRAVKELARELGMSENTARGHVRMIHTKTGTHSLGGLFVWAREHATCCTLGSRGVDATA